MSFFGMFPHCRDVSSLPFPCIYRSPFTDQASHQRGEKQGAADRGVWALKASGYTIGFAYNISYDIYVYRDFVYIHAHIYIYIEIEYVYNV